MTTAEERVRTAIAEQAGEWFVRYQAGPLPTADAAAFLAWLKSSPMHVEEYLGVARVAQDLRGTLGMADVSLERFITSFRNEEDRVLSFDRPAPRRATGASRRLRVAQIAASVLLLASGALWWSRDGEILGIPKSYQTSHGEQSVRLLPDGSVLRLDTDSAVTVRYSRAERLIVVERGQVFFEVVHNQPNRWFRVTVANAEAIAVGTRFSVYRHENMSEFTVAEGEIAAYVGTHASTGGANVLPANGIRVATGYQLRINTKAISAQLLRVNPQQAFGWLEHKIIFEHRPLAEVAKEFNRYARVPIDVEDSELGALPISGNFDADDLDSFLAYLERLPGIRVERVPARIRVSSVASGM
jgi:transmembrane sensor